MVIFNNLSRFLIGLWFVAFRVLLQLFFILDPLLLMLLLSLLKSLNQVFSRLCWSVVHYVSQLFFQINLLAVKIRQLSQILVFLSLQLFVAHVDWFLVQVLWLSINLRLKSAIFLFLKFLILFHEFDLLFLFNLIKFHFCSNGTIHSSTYSWAKYLF
jgi:hypothetical protein